MNQITIATKAHKEGRKAYRDGKFHSSNPYNPNPPIDSDEWLRRMNWNSGWYHEFFKDKPKGFKQG